MLRKASALVRQQTLGALALFVALGGTSYGVATNSIDSREIKNNSVRSKDVRNGSLLAKDFKARQLPAGPRGATGPQGPTGATGAPGSARAFAFVDALSCSGGPGTACPINRSKGITSVSRGTTGGTYCVAAPGLSPSSLPAFGTPWSGSISGATIEVGTDPRDDSPYCPPGEFTILTYAIFDASADASPTLRGDLDFNVLIP